MVGRRRTTARTAVGAILVAISATTVLAQQPSDPPGTSSPAEATARAKERLIDGGQGGVAGTGLGKVPEGKDTGKGMSVPGRSGAAVEPGGTPPN